MKIEIDLIKHLIKLDLDDLKREMIMDYYKELPFNSFIVELQVGNYQP